MARDKIKTLEELKEILEKFKAEGKTVVFTNGCFDLLHLGHIRYLEVARKMGDLLVVAINTDSSVRRLKGPERPLKSQEERAEILASLEMVNYVVLFDEDTPSRILEILKPHIQVKGGDYRAEEIPEYSLVKAYGGKVVIVPLLEGYSTTSFLEKNLRGKCGNIHNGQ